jgi:predicted dehydrogenase
VHIEENKTKKFNNSIIVGYGSIGKKHAEYLKSVSNCLHIIDPKYSLSSSNQINPIKAFKSFSELKIELSDNDVAVVSNWGPDHFETVEKIAKIGITQIILEKPCVDSLEEIDLIRNLAEKFSLKISVNQGWYYLELGKRIVRLGEKLKLGLPVAIWFTGGARCLSTAGSHWVSLANEIFSSAPSQIIADANSDSINPRSENLSFIEGIFSFKYSEGKRLGICLTNKSAIEGKLEIYWRNAIGVLEDEIIQIYLGNQSEEDKRITSYVKANTLIYKGNVPESDDTSKFGMQSLYNSFLEHDTSKFYTKLNHHLLTTKSIILALIASETREHLNFDSKVDRHLYKKKYRIS